MLIFESADMNAVHDMLRLGHGVCRVRISRIDQNGGKGWLLTRWSICVREDLSARRIAIWGHLGHSGSG